MRTVNSKTRNYIIAALLLVFIVCVPSIASARPLRMYAPDPEDSFKTQGLIDATKEIKKLTNGKVDIKVYPGGQLGGYEESVEEVRQGTIELSATWLTKRWDPRLDLLNLPYYAPLGYKQLAKVAFSANSPLPKKIDSILNELGLVSLGPWPESYATLIFAKGKRPEKFTGFENKKRSIRVPAMPLYRDTYVAMGYQTVTMDVSELWSAMQTGQVDGASGQPLENVYLLGKDIIKHVDANRSVCPPMWLMINKDIWKSFSKEEQKIVRDTFNKHSLKTLQIMDQKDKEYAQLLKKAGIEVAEYPDQHFVEFGAHIRKVVWPKYYNVFGKDFLKNLDKMVVETSKSTK